MSADALTYCGWGYEAGRRYSVVHIFEAPDGTVIGVANARYEADGDEYGVYYYVEWDRVGTLPKEAATPAWPTHSDLTLGELTDEQHDEWCDGMRDALREIITDD